MGHKDPQSAGLDSTETKVSSSNDTVSKNHISFSGLRDKVKL
jgi:hypothetical protein